MVQQDRSFVKWLLLSIVTCGIYSLVFMYQWIKDINTICDGDGKETKELLILILLSIVTCGIYSWVWYYGVADRMYENGKRYNVEITETGTTVLLWLILGSVIAVGPYVAMYILINNTNKLAAAYNSNNGSIANA